MQSALTLRPTLAGRAGRQAAALAPAARSQRIGALRSRTSAEGLAAPRRAAAKAAIASSSSPSAPATIPVRIVVPEHELPFGSGVRAVGEAAALGGWDVDAAPVLEWAEGHTWSADLALPAGGEVTFKLVILHADGAVDWEPGPDRVVRLPGAAALAGAGGGAAEVVCVYGSTGSTGLAATAGPESAVAIPAALATASGDAMPAPPPPSAAPLDGDEEADVTPFAVWPAHAPAPPPVETPADEAPPAAAAAAARAARAAAGAASAVATAEAERVEAEVEDRQAGEEAARAASFFASFSGVSGAAVGTGGEVMLSFDEEGDEDAAAAAARLLKKKA